MELFQPILLEIEGARPRNVLEESLARVRESDVYVAILGKEYSKATTEEYAEARQNDLPCYVYRKVVLDVDPNVESFIVELRPDVKYQSFSSGTELVKFVKLDLIDFVLDHAEIGIGMKSQLKVSPKVRIRQPSLIVAPGVGIVGASFVASGSGFESRESLSLFVDKDKVETNFFRSDWGDFLTLFEMPSLPGGTHDINIEGTSGHTATRTFTLVSYFATNPSFDSTGKTSRINGTGFSANSAISIAIDGVLSMKDAARTNSKGEFSLESKMGEKLASGSHVITVIDAKGLTVSRSFVLVSG